MNDTELIKAITDACAWYHENSRETTLELLMRAYDKLTANLFTLGEAAARAKDNYNSAYFMRKIEVSKKRQALRAKQHTGGDSDHAAIVETEEFLKNENAAESYANRIDIMLRQGNRVADAMRTRISWMKNEGNLLDSQP